jgi:hypothetical protein
MFLTFSNTILLIGLAGAVVPLVLHLLSRSRYQSLDWGAMLFLEGIEARQQYSTRVNQVLLLVARMAVVALLAIALAQPVLRQWGPDAEAGMAALRTADRGQLLSIGGAIACGALTITMIALLISSGRRKLLRSARFGSVVIAIIATLAAIWLGRRAMAWDHEVRRLMAEQPQMAVRAASAGALRPRVDAAILLDCSSAMDFEENGHTRFSLAQGAAKQVLAGLRRGDRALLVLMGKYQSDSELEPTSDLQSVADRIDAAHTGRKQADVAEGLLKAQEVLDREGGAARDFYIVCDRRAANWRNVNDYFLTRRWPQALQRSSAAVRMFMVPVGDNDASNVAVESIALASPPAIIGQPATIEVEVHNYGPTPRSAVPLTVWLNGRTAFDTTVSVGAASVSRVSVPVKATDFPAAGSQVVAAEVRTSGYRDDDHCDAVVEAIEPIKVLVISGDELEGSAGQFRSESDFLKLALSPLAALHRHGPDPCKVDVIGADQWASVDLQQYQVVVLANIERFMPGQSRAIEQYVYGGGGVLIAPGNLSRVDNFNQELWRDGAGILPAELQEPTAADGSEATTIVGTASDTPVFQFLHDQPDLPLSATIGRYFPTSSRPSDSKTLAWYTSGAPFLVESHAGRGKVLLMTTSLDADWSTLPLSSFYLPFVQSAVRYLAAGSLQPRDLVLGEPIQGSIDDPLDDHVTVELPDGDQRQVPLSRYNATGDFRFSETHDPGIYRVRARDRGGEKVMLFAIQLPHDASDMTQLTDPRWDELEADLHLQRIDPNDRAIATVVSGAHEGYDLWPWALGAVMILGTLELGLARHWSKDAY